MNLTSKKIHSDFIDIFNSKILNPVSNQLAHTCNKTFDRTAIEKQLAYLAKFTICNFIDMSNVYGL